jgi:protease-4
VAAKGLGLVDNLGGIEDAEAAAAKLADLKPGGYQMHEFEPDRDVFGQWLLRLFGSRADLGSLIAAVLPQQQALQQPLQDAAQLLRRFNDPRGMYAYCFCTPTPAGR